MAVRISLEDCVRTVMAVSLAALVAGSLLVPVKGAPVTENEEKPWWHNPCNYKIRHSRGIPPAVKYQLKTITSTFSNVVSPKIQKYCSKFEDTIDNKQIKKPDWLPSRRFFNSLGDSISTLPEFHYQIQVHAATLHKLSTARIEAIASSFDEAEREDILNITAQHMKSLLCEVETAMNMTKYQKKGLVPINYVSDAQIPPTSNFTTGVITDCTLLREYGNFLKKSCKKLSGKKPRPRKAKGKAKAGKARKANKNKKRTSRRRS